MTCDVNNPLHLDNVVAFWGVVFEYHDEEDSFFKTQVLSRIFLIVHSVLLVAHGSVKQATRGVALLFSGYVTYALKDFLSIIVQAIILPILGIISIFSPELAGDGAKTLKEAFNESAKSIPASSSGSEGIAQKYEVRQYIHENFNLAAQVLLRLTSIVQTINLLVLGILRNLLMFNTDRCQLLFIPVLFGVTYRALKNFDYGIEKNFWNTLRVHGLNGPSQIGFA